MKRENLKTDGPALDRLQVKLHQEEAEEIRSMAESAHMDVSAILRICIHKGLPATKDFLSNSKVDLKQTAPQTISKRKDQHKPGASFSISDTVANAVAGEAAASAKTKARSKRRSG